MRLADLVTAIHDAFDPGQAMADLAAVCAHDRYQASAGITAAASYVAERAEAAGLTEVSVLSFPADGTQRWWTYRAPLPWTPVRARLAVNGITLVRYPRQPYTLAAYSAPTPPRRLPLVRWSAVRLGADPGGALVVVDEPVGLGVIAGPLTAAGAVAVVADPLSGRPDRDREQVGRLELPAGGRLAGFSVTAAQLASLTAAAEARAAATVEVVVDEGAGAMPVVTGLLPGTSDEEMLLTAHLCHPRPSANDNASGVAALLGAARVLAGAARTEGPGVRFLWGPEFSGVAAYLHDQVGSGRTPPPALAVNVDMAGQDVRRCGGPLVIERGPDDIPSFLPGLAGRCAALLPPASRSYSGAVPCDPWTWRATPFAGGSDHALLADVPARCQVAALGHWPDRANHSSADTPDLVDPAELRRTAVIACAVAAAVRGRADPGLAADVGDATVSWAAEHVLATLPGRRPVPVRTPASPGDGQNPGAVLNPRDDANAGRWLRHRQTVALGAIRALSEAGAEAGWLRSATAWLDSIAAASAERLSDPAKPGPRDHGRALQRNWAGPVNLRALAEAAGPADRDWLERRLGADRGGNYARAVALMRAVDGDRDRDEVTWWAALSSELPMPVTFAGRFIDLMSRAGWATHGGDTKRDDALGGGT
jgi:hypothetical protein